jgi:hypothetical protein
MPRELRSYNVWLILFSLVVTYRPTTEVAAQLLRSYLRPDEPMEHRNRQMRQQFGRRWLRRLSKWFNF